VRGVWLCCVVALWGSPLLGQTCISFAECLPLRDVSQTNYNERLFQPVLAIHESAESPELTGAVHDLGHSAAAASVILLLEAVGVEELHAYLLGTVALPIVQELADGVRFGLIRGGKWPNWDSAHDLLTYQAPWSILLFKRGEYFWAAVVTVGYVLYVGWWNYSCRPRACWR